jgi:hypothetical protein
MKTFIKIIFICIFSFLLCYSLLAQESDEPSITFIVPVQLTNIHQDVEMVRVICDVRDANGVKVGTGNTVEHDIPNGNLQKEFRVEITQLSGKDLTDARTYECSLNLHNGELWAEINDPGVGIYEFQAKENTTLVKEVTGQIQP